MSLFKRHSETKIVELIKQRDESILPYIFKEYYTLVRNFVLKHNGDEDEVEDVMQETVIAIWKNISNTNFHLTSKLGTYILAIAKNIWFKKLRKRTKMTKVNFDRSEASSSAEEYNPKIDLITDLVKDLDETCKLLLTYFYFDGMKNEEIAEKMSLKNTNTVKSKKYQCMRKLEDLVKASYNWEDFF